MARKRPRSDDPVFRKLDQIHSALQDLFIIQARLAGIRKAEARAIVGVGDARVSRIWRAMRIPGPE